MANIRPRKDKNGEIISYEIRVFKGRDSNGKQLKPYTMTWKIPQNMTAKQIEKELKRQEVQFEEQCKLGIAGDGKQTFERYADYVIGLKERTGTKHSVIVRYRELLKRINESIGHLKIADIRPQHLNLLYEQLSQKGIRENSKKAECKTDLKRIIKENGLTKAKVCEIAGVADNTLTNCFNKKLITYQKAEQIANALNVPVKSLFNVVTDETPLSSNTVKRHHNLISTILTQAEKEMLIPYNPAKKATPPKAEKPKPNYFQTEDVEKIRDALELIELKYKVLVHLYLITGCRRGEIAGLKWSMVDWKNSQIHIENNLMYKKDWGLYEDDPKTETSNRKIKLPAETMDLLKEYREYWLDVRRKYGSKWNETLEIRNKNGEKRTVKSDYLFIQEKGDKIGYPMNPDTATSWCDKFSKTYNLPHINPHAFRHTAVSLLYFAGMDIVSISAHLGHSQVSTTQNLYAHVMAEAESKIADCMGDIIITSRKKRFPANSESTDNTKDKTEIKTG